MADAPAAPQGTDPPVVPPAAPPAAVTPPAPAAVVNAPPGDPAWLRPRLEDAKNTAQQQLLKELGFTDVASAKAAAAAAKAAADAGKTAEQRAAELAASLASTQTEAQRYAATINEHTARMMGVLTPKQQELVKSLAGDDAANQLATIRKLTDAGALVIDADETPPPPANTAPPPTAPNGAPGTSLPDHRAEYARLRASNNPFAAAAYGMRHANEVYTPKG